MHFRVLGEEQLEIQLEGVGENLVFFCVLRLFERVCAYFLALESGLTLQYGMPFLGRKGLFASPSPHFVHTKQPGCHRSSIAFIDSPSVRVPCAVHGSMGIRRETEKGQGGEQGITPIGFSQPAH